MTEPTPSTEPRRPARAHLRAALHVLCLALAVSLSAQEPPRTATSARPTPDADNESDDSSRQPLGRKTVVHTLSSGAAVSLAFGLPKTGGREYNEMESLAAGKVVRFFETAAIKLSTSSDLLFGETRIRTNNVAPDYPGVYSLWIERTADGWRLLFNEKADAWGTQHDPAADVAHAPLRHDSVDGLTSELAGALRASAQDDGTVLLEFHWGAHRWTAEFREAP